jgi:hypothetical protein
MMVGPEVKTMFSLKLLEGSFCREFVACCDCQDLVAFDGFGVLLLSDGSWVSELRRLVVGGFLVGGSLGWRQNFLIEIYLCRSFSFR